MCKILHSVCMCVSASGGKIAYVGPNIGMASLVICMKPGKLYGVFT